MNWRPKKVVIPDNNPALKNIESTKPETKPSGSTTNGRSAEETQASKKVSSSNNQVNIHNPHGDTDLTDRKAATQQQPVAPPAPANNKVPLPPPLASISAPAPPLPPLGGAAVTKASEKTWNKGGNQKKLSPKAQAMLDKMNNQVAAPAKTEKGDFLNSIKSGIKLNKNTPANTETAQNNGVKTSHKLIDNGISSVADIKGATTDADSKAKEIAKTMGIPHKTIELAINYEWKSNTEDITPYIKQLTTAFYTFGVTKHFTTMLKPKFSDCNSEAGKQYLQRAIETAKEKCDEVIDSQIKLIKFKITKERNSIRDLLEQKTPSPDLEKREKTILNHINSITKFEKEIKELNEKRIEKPVNAKSVSDVLAVIPFGSEYTKARDYIKSTLIDKVSNKIESELLPESELKSLYTYGENNKVKQYPNIEKLNKLLKVGFEKYGLTFPSKGDIAAIWNKDNLDVEYTEIQYFENEINEGEGVCSNKFPFNRVELDDFEKMETYEAILLGNYKPRSLIMCAAQRLIEAAQTASEKEIKEAAAIVVNFFGNYSAPSEKN